MKKFILVTAVALSLAAVQVCEGVVLTNSTGHVLTVHLYTDSQHKEIQLAVGESLNDTSFLWDQASIYPNDAPAMLQFVGHIDTQRSYIVNVINNEIKLN